MAESKEKLNSLWVKVKEKSEKVWLKLNIQKTKIMASGPSTSRKIDAETMETDRLHFSGLQNHCRWWLQPWNYKTLAPWKKSYSQPQFSSVAQLCPTLCDPMNRSTPGLPVHHQFPEFTQTHVHRTGDAIEPSHPLSSPSPPAPNASQHQSLFQWVNSSHGVAKVLEFQL